MRIRLAYGRYESASGCYFSSTDISQTRPSTVVSSVMRWCILCIFAAVLGACSGSSPLLENYAPNTVARDIHGSVETTAGAIDRQRITKQQKTRKRQRVARQQKTRKRQRAARQQFVASSNLHDVGAKDPQRVARRHKTKKRQRVARQHIFANASLHDFGAVSTLNTRGKADFQGTKRRAATKKNRRYAHNRYQRRGRRAEHTLSASLDRTTTTSIRKKTTVTRKKRRRAGTRKRSRVTKLAKNNRRRRIASSTIMSAVRNHAREAGVPVSVGLAVVHQESGFNPKARGQVGEIGLMQVKCATARTMGYRGRCSGLYNVNTNLRYGMKYLKKAINKGSVAYYNAGLGAKKVPAQARKYARAVASKKRGY